MNFINISKTKKCPKCGADIYLYNNYISYIAYRCKNKECIHGREFFNQDIVADFEGNISTIEYDYSIFPRA